MSDSDDGFDKEAAREELREKYESEREDREATARMSELLLQGATMTNDHCDRCGTPLFRQSGQTFCPNCQHAAQQGDTQQSDQEDGDRQSADRDAPAQPPAASDSPPQSDQPAEPRQPAGDAAGEDTRDRRQADQSAPPAPNRSPERASRDRNLPEHAPTAGQQPQSGEAAAALESSIAALARRAASADDPRTAREYLEAAREAAEALAALR